MKILSGVCLLLGAFLGAGFVSGRELSFYFARFEEYALLNIIVSIIVLFVGIVFFFGLAKKGGFEMFAQKYFGKSSKAIEMLIVISLVILCGSMLAGTYTLSQSLNINGVIGVVITILLVWAVVMGEIKWVSRVNIIFVPIIIVVIIVASFLNWKGGVVLQGNMGEGMLFGINYVLVNIVPLGIFLIDIGGNYTTKQKVVIAIITSLIIGLMTIIMVSVIICNNIVDCPMPIIQLAESSAVLCNLVKISIYIGIFTSIIANMYMVARFCGRYFSNKHLVVLSALVLSYLLSMIGFELIVGYVYSVIGIIGAIIIIVIIVSSIKNSVCKNIQSK